MTPEIILAKAEKAGVKISLGRNGKIKLSGEHGQVNQLVPVVRSDKAELLQFLQRIESDKKPFITNGELRIPLNCASRYRYWQAGQSLFDTLLELGASDDLVEAYIGPVSNPDAWCRWEQIKQSRGEDHGRN